MKVIPWRDSKKKVEEVSLKSRKLHSVVTQSGAAFLQTYCYGDIR